MEDRTSQEIANPTYRRGRIQPQPQLQDNTDDEQDMDVDNAFEKNTSHKDSSSEDDSSDDSDGSTNGCYDKDGNEEEEDKDEEEDNNNNQTAQIYENNLRAPTESITLQHMAADGFQDDTYDGQHYSDDAVFQPEDVDINHVVQRQLFEGECFQLLFHISFVQQLIL